MRILVVDDHAVVRRGVCELLREAFPDAAFDEGATGEDALQKIGRWSYRLVVLDISMPRRGGLEALGELRRLAPDTPVIVLSQHAEHQYAVRSLRAGARAYLTKSAAPEELVRAATKVLSGGRYVTEAVAERLLETWDTAYDKEPHESLSTRELQVLRLLAKGKTVKAIGAELDLSVKTVSTYRTRLLAKLTLSSTAELVRYALESGLVD